MVASLLLLIPHLQFGVILTPSFSLTQFGPTVGLLLFSFFLGSSAPLRDAFTRFRIRKLLSWGIIAVLTTGVILFLCGELLSLWGLPFTSWGGKIGFYSMEGLAMMICCAGEEIGWRGFLLPELCKSRSLFVSSLIVGLFWGVWHLNFTGGLFGFLLFIVSIMMNSVFIAWLFQKSGGNLFVAIVEHFSFNLFSHLFLWNRFSIKGYVVEIIFYGILDLTLACFDRKLFFTCPQKQSKI
jgi:membrane protease YdiL (CAAX protease family)